LELFGQVWLLRNWIVGEGVALVVVVDVAVDAALDELIHHN